VTVPFVRLIQPGACVPLAVADPVTVYERNDAFCVGQQFVSGMLDPSPVDELYPGGCGFSGSQASCVPV
jgi:hypothetical protein